MGLCGGFTDEVRTKKMRQDGGAKFISASVKVSDTQATDRYDRRFMDNKIA